MPRRRVATAALIVAGAAAALAASAAVADDPPPVLHEDLAPRGPARASADPAAGVIGVGEAGKNPAAAAVGEKLIPEPEASVAGGASPVFGAGGFATGRVTEHAPNAQTAADGALHYVEVFNPAVVPFKRMSSLDAVREDYTLYAADAGARTELPVGGAPRAGFDRFWGSMRVSLRPGVDVAIPSVAADMRILSYETTPRTALAFSRDAADNYFVRSDEPDAAGVHQLVFLAEADPRYVVPPVPDRGPVSRLDGRRVRPLPPAVALVARRALRTLGLDRSTRIDVALNTLVAYFRGFQPGAPPPDTGDIYWDLFASRRGVCRHRAFAFVVTANALGIPARFLGNEAHAWVEVHLPTGWARIDLGGAAAELDVANAAQKTMYQPRGQDPFARPREYAENYTRLTGDVSGLSSEQLAEARTPRSPLEEPSAGGAAAAGPGADRGANGTGGATDPTAPGAAASVATGLPTPDPVRAATQQATRVEVNRASASGYRGESIAIAGTVASGGRGLAGLRIELYLARAGRRGADARLVGHTVSDGDGGFRAEVVLPADLALDRHEVYAATPGDATFAASVSR